MGFLTNLKQFYFQVLIKVEVEKRYMLTYKQKLVCLLFCTHKCKLPLLHNAFYKGHLVGNVHLV